MNSSLDNVHELLRLGYGDAYRLGDIKKRLESGTILYASDNNYLEKLVYQYSKEIQKVITHKKTKPTRIPEPKREPIPEPYEQYQPEPTPEPTAVDESEVLVSKKDPNERRNATLGGLFFLFGGLAFMFIIPWGGDGGTVYHSHQICNVFPGAGPDACDTIGWFMIAGTISVILGLLGIIGSAINTQKS